MFNDVKIMKFNSISLSLVICLCVIQLNAQEQLKVELEWSEKSTSLSFENKKLTSISSLENSFFDGESFLHLSNFNRSSSQEWELEVKDYSYTSANEDDKKMINDYNLKIHEELQFNVRHIKEKEIGKVAIELVPFIKQGNNIVKLTDVTFEKSEKPIFQMKNGHEFAENSVLASGSGEWYKIRVREDGVHRISYSFLSDIGIDVDNINPQNINIYGNGFGLLPENNSDFRPDDLLKNAIYI